MSVVVTSACAVVLKWKTGASYGAVTKLNDALNCLGTAILCSCCLHSDGRIQAIFAVEAVQIGFLQGGNLNQNSQNVLLTAGH